MSALDGLNKQQLRAATAADGPLLVVAGPGTGKTKTLTARIVHLLQTGNVDPGVLLALTFTNKAAREMQERVAAQLGAVRLPLITTFHALASRLLPQQESKCLATAQELTAITKHVKRLFATKGMSDRDVALRISKAKNQAVAPDEPTTRQLVDAYNAELLDQGLYDFDDMLLELRHHLAEVKSPYAYILVDEFQDTNDLQYDILRLLAPHGNVMAIGDPLQSIYGFRGASAAVFERFACDWPDATTIRLSVSLAVVLCCGAVITIIPTNSARLVTSRSYIVLTPPPKRCNVPLKLTACHTK